MLLYQPMQVDSLTLSQVAELSAPGWGEPTREQIQRTMNSIAGAFPIGLVVLAPGGIVVQGREIVSAVRALMDHGLHVRLSDQRVLPSPNVATVPIAVLRSGVESTREERRLQAAGVAHMVATLHHLHRRWLDHRVPVVRLAHDAVQP